MQQSDPKIPARQYGGAFVLGFIAGSSPKMLLYMIPVLVFGLWRWQGSMDLSLFLAMAALFILVWGGSVAWLWRKFRKQPTSGEPDRSTFGGGFQAGYVTAKVL